MDVNVWIDAARDPRNGAWLFVRNDERCRAVAINTFLPSYAQLSVLYCRIAEAGMRSLFPALFIGMLLTGPVLAERADRDKPVHIEADQASVQDASKLATFTGNVVLTQGTLIIRADKMTVKEDASGFQYATAFGNLASFRQKRDGMDEYIEGWSERMEYDGKADKMQLFRKARLKRGQDEVHGDYISYDAINEFFQVTSSGNGAPAQTNSDGRVRAVIQPKKKEQKPTDEGQ